MFNSLYQPLDTNWFGTAVQRVSDIVLIYELPGTLFLLILSLLFFVGVREVWVARYIGHPLCGLVGWLVGWLVGGWVTQ